MGGKKKNPLQQVGWNSHGGPIFAGLFKMHDTVGFSLADSIAECRRHGCTPSLPSFVADAVLAGWPAERAIDKVIENRHDAEQSRADDGLVRRGLQIVADRAEQFSTGALVERFAAFQAAFAGDG
jgi:hypothetical protein